MQTGGQVPGRIVPGEWGSVDGRIGVNVAGVRPPSVPVHGNTEAGHQAGFGSAWGPAWGVSYFVAWIT